MADFGAVETLLNGLSSNQDKYIHQQVWKRVMPDQRFGRAIAGEAAKNMGGGYFAATTPSVANTEFIVPHSFGRPPYLLIPILPLDQLNARIVELKNTRLPDALNVYLSSPVTSATIFFYLEG